MKKLELLRTWLLDSKLMQTDQLHVFSRDGYRQSNHSLDDHNFMLHYKARIVITDFAKDPRLVFASISIWLDLHEPNSKADALKFKSDILDHEKSDLELEVSLSEPVILEETEAGIKLSECVKPIYPTDWEDSYKNKLPLMIITEDDIPDMQAQP